MKFTFLFIFLLFSCHLQAQETEKPIRTIKVHPKPKSVEVINRASMIIIAEEMPMFRDTNCLKLPSLKEQKACADQKLMQFISRNLYCPDSLRANTIDATVILSYTLATDGSINNIQVLRGSQNVLFAQECIRVLKLTVEQNGPWIPARQRGQVIPIQMNLPFRLRIR